MALIYKSFITIIILKKNPGKGGIPLRLIIRSIKTKIRGFGPTHVVLGSFMVFISMCEKIIIMIEIEIK